MMINTTHHPLSITINIEDPSLSLHVKKMLSGSLKLNPFFLDPLSGPSLEMFPILLPRKDKPAVKLLLQEL